MNTKEKILKTANDLLLEKDYNSISLNLIADKIGIKKPSIYYYFTSKKELYVEVIKRIMADFDDEFDKIAEKEEEAEQKIKDFIFIFLFYGHRKRINLKNFLIERFEKNKGIYHSNKIRSTFLERLEGFLLQYEKENKVIINKKDIALSIVGVSGALMADLIINNKKITKKDFKKITEKVVLILLK